MDIQEIRWNERYAERTHHMTSSAIRELLKLTEQPDFISFGGGLPAPEVFPVEEVRAVCDRVLSSSGPQALQYGATEGYRPLRELLAANLSAPGLQLSVDNILITTGSQQAIDLLGKVFLDPNDAVIVESPTYLAALQSWRAYQARFLSVASDDHGMETAHLEELVTRHAEIGEPAKMVYCLPNFQNPSGVTLTLNRRKELVDISLRHGLPVIEDDPYHELRFEGQPLPRLIELEASQRGSQGVPYGGGIISLGTFSKILAPGLRVGWMVADPGVISHLVQAKQGTDLHTPTFNQMIAYEMLRSGFLEEHKHVILQTYRTRRDVMLTALEEHFPPDARWTRPEGGMFLWVELPTAVDAADLLQECVQHRVAFVPGQSFHADGSGPNTMRLNFSNSTPEQIREGIARIGESLQKLLQQELVAAHSM